MVPPDTTTFGTEEVDQLAAFGEVQLRSVVVPVAWAIGTA